MKSIVFCVFIFVSPLMAIVDDVLDKKIIDAFAICKLATVDENTGYHYHPSDCSKFLQCYPGVRDYRIETRKCPFGMFWDEDTVTCRPPKDVMCAGDPCIFVDEGYTYKYSKERRAFWRCENETSVAHCCPVGQTFSPGYGCVDTPGANEPCPPKPKMDNICNRVPYVHDYRYYLEFVPNFGTIRRPCAPGAAFEHSTCECSKTIGVDYYKTVCKPVIQFTFKLQERDIYHTIGNAKFNNVRYTKRERVWFRGDDSYINIWRLANVDFATKMMISFRFRQTGDSKNIKQALLSNSNSEIEGPSILIHLNTRQQRVVFKMFTYEGEYASFSLPYKHGFNTVMLIYDGEHAIGMVNGSKFLYPMHGGIVRRQSGIYLGSAPLLGNFQGYMDDVMIYQCIP